MSHGPRRRLGIVVRRARTAAGLTTRELARRIGTWNTAITNWEKGHVLHPLDEDRVRVLAEALGLDDGELYGVLMAEHFVAALPGPVLRVVRERLQDAVASFCVDTPDGKGLVPGREDGPAGGGRESLIRTELADAVAESGHLETGLARAALQGGMIPAAEVELVVGRLMNVSQVADLLLILGAGVRLDFAGEKDLGLELWRKEE